MTVLLSTKEVAKFLNVNEKMIYTLVAEKNLPATKITGKWAFPKHLVEQWIDTSTINYPKSSEKVPGYEKLLIITGSNDLLLNSTISLFNQQYPEYVAVFGNLGSMGGLKMLCQNQCHIAVSHLLQENEQDYNFEFAKAELQNVPAIVNFCQREQGILLQKGNPKKIKSVSDLGKKGIRVVNRPLGTGTRLLLEYELRKAKLNTDKIEGYAVEKSSHMDVGLEVLTGRADAGPGIRAVSFLLGLDFLPLRWERFDLLIPKEKFFEKPVQLFLGLLHEESFRTLFPENCGYNLETTGKVIFPTD
ncbi:helix-turn-helix transcriptional regulator [bacterium]|nr:helix-turn-helix transcriptional regulator [bacterium]